MRFFKTLAFAIKARLQNKARISLSAYLKGHQRISVGRRCKIHGESSIDASYGGDVHLGDGVTLNRYAYLQAGSGGIRLGHGVEINNFTIVNGAGGVEIGDGTLIGPGVRIISYQHRFHGHEPVRKQPSTAKPIRIGKDVWIGANAAILAGVTIGEGAVVGAGAVVTGDVPDWAVVVGVPARVMKIREAN